MVVEEEEHKTTLPSSEKDDASSVMSMIQNAMKNEDGEDIVDIREAWDDSLHVAPSSFSRGCETSLPAHNEQEEEEDILLDMILESNLDDVEEKSPNCTFAGFDKGFLLQRPRVEKETQVVCERPRVEKETQVTTARPSSLKQPSGETGGLERKPLSKFKQSRMKSIPSS